MLLFMYVVKEKLKLGKFVLFSCIKTVHELLCDEKLGCLVIGICSIYLEVVISLVLLVITKKLIGQKFCLFEYNYDFSFD